MSPLSPRFNDEETRRGAAEEESLTRENGEETLSHEGVTATVSVTGLALGCYNPVTQTYEVGLIREGCHELKITVVKKLAEGSSTLRFFLDSDNDYRIFIVTENGILPDNPFFTTGTPFSRTNPTHNAEDFRWVVDFEKELNNEQEVVLKRPQVPVTEMYVSKPRLYADTDRFVLDDFKLVNTTPGVTTEPQLFGRFTEGIKGDLRCQNGGGIILRVEGPLGFQVYLPHTGGAAHEIIVDNRCPEEEENPEITDFNLYYTTIITETAGGQFDVKLANDDVEGEGAVCNGSFLGVRTNLFPLPE